MFCCIGWTLFRVRSQFRVSSMTSAYLPIFDYYIFIFSPIVCLCSTLLVFARSFAGFPRSAVTNPPLDTIKSVHGVRCDFLLNSSSVHQ